VFSEDTSDYVLVDIHPERFYSWKYQKNNEWAKKPVHLEINAKILCGEITTAVLVTASKIEKDEEK